MSPQQVPSDEAGPQPEAPDHPHTGPTRAGDPSGLLSGRFQRLRLVKEDQGIATFLGTDLQGGAAVMIKTAAASAIPAGLRLRLQHDAEVHRAIHSPFVAALVDAGRQDDVLFAVTPVVPGVSLAQRLAQGPLSVAETLAVGRCLMRALHEAHDRGVLHRDVKPSNIMVDSADGVLQAILIDFGLARSGRLKVPARDLPAETAVYLAPEQAGLLHQEVDERADLYAAGVVLFECVSGRPPFSGTGLGEVLRQHLAARPPALRGLGFRVPRALEEVVQRLLRKDPRERYQSAQAVLADLDQIAAALEGDDAEPCMVVGLHDRRRLLTEPSFVGRGQELAALEVQQARARHGQGGLVLLEAASGGGKTRLLEELAQRSAQQGAWILRGQGVDQAAQRPFQVLDGVVAGLLEATCEDGGLAAAIRERLGDQRDGTCDALPQLAAVLGAGTPAGLGPEAFGEHRSLRALTALLDVLGTEARPALVLLDDCQWADELSLKLLLHWHNRLHDQRPGALHVVVVAAFRSEEVAHDHRLRRAQPAAHLVLPPFCGEDLRGLAESMAGRLPEEALAAVERLSGGSPFMASAVLRGLVETGAIRAGPAGWQVVPAAMADVQSSRQAAALLGRRLKLLPPTTLRLLAVGAVLGKEFDIDFVSALADLAPHQAAIALDEARRRHIIWLNAADGRYSFSHDKLREALLELLPAEERQGLHRLAARHLEGHDRQRVFELAYHFDAGGEHQRAFPYALAAAEQARSRHALAIAEQQYEIARRGSREADAATHQRLAEGLGNVLMLRGRYAEAEEHFHSAKGLAQQGPERARIEGRLGELALKRGNVRHASEALERGLRLLGRLVPRRRPLLWVMLLWEIVVQTLHTLLPGLFVARRRREGADRELLAVTLYNRLAYAYWFERGVASSMWTHLRGLNLAERYPATPELAQAYSEHAPGMTMVPYFRRGIAYAEKSLAMRRAFGDAWGQGQSLHFQGVVLYAASRYQECMDKCREAIRILERTGDQWEINTARWHIAFCLYRQGHLHEAAEEARRIHQSALEIGDHQSAGISLGAWSKASGGRVPQELVRAALARNVEDVHTAAEVLMAEGVRLLGTESPAEAVLVLEEADRRVRAKGMRQEYVSPVVPWLATALRQAMETAPACAPRRRRALLRRACRVARRAVRIARRYQNNLPHALREQALLAAARGRPRRARKLLAESLAVAERQGARYEWLLTLQARARVGLELGWPAAADELAEAAAALSVLHPPAKENAQSVGDAEARPVTLSLADRFDTVLTAGRQIVSALSPQAIYAAARDGAQKLLRGEGCLVLGVSGTGDGPELEVVAGEPGGAFSRTLARRALAAGHPIVVDDGLSGEAGESMLLSGLRSALYAPFFVRGQAVGCLCVTHRQVGCLFGEDEQRLAEFLSTVAGAALENAEGFAELQKLNAVLESRVAERTAAAEDRARELVRANMELENQVAERRRAEEKLQHAVVELQAALAKIKTLGGLLPICASCKMIRDDHGYWHQVELYIKEHSDANFSHGLCPACAGKFFPGLGPVQGTAGHPAHHVVDVGDQVTPHGR